MKKRNKVIITTIAAVGLGSFFLMANSNKEPIAIEIQTVLAKPAKIVQKVNATGKIQPKTQVKISADVSAKIMLLNVKEGDWVEKGQLLIELDRKKYLASVESQEANVRSAQANTKLAKENKNQAERVYKRAKELLARKLESQSELDRVQANFMVEVARYESALDQVERNRGLLKQTQDDLSKTRIYAPMSGTVSDLNKEQGEIAIGSQFQEDVVMVIANLNEMEALVNVDENDIIAIQLAQDSQVEVDALLGQNITGEVFEIASSANSTGNGNNAQKTEFEVKIAITSPNKQLRPGMTASADIVTHTRDNALSVPIQSVTVRTVEQLKTNPETADGEYVAGKDGFVELVFVVENNKVVAKQVTTGIQSDDLIEIISGIKEGDQIVSGNYRAISRDLKNGDMVSVSNGKANKGKS